MTVPKHMRSRYAQRNRPVPAQPQAPKKLPKISDELIAKITRSTELCCEHVYHVTATGQEIFQLIQGGAIPYDLKIIEKIRAGTLPNEETIFTFELSPTGPLKTKVIEKLGHSQPFFVP